jgi:DnaJ-class molecular chaperone
MNMDDKKTPRFIPIKCPNCNGWGTVTNLKKPCHSCNGKGIVVVDQKTGLVIDEGMIYEPPTE